MSKTLNKDGTPRKIGSGKTKGAGCFTDITWSKLKNIIGEETKIPVSRVWIKNLGISSEIKSPKTIQKASVGKKEKQIKRLPIPKITHKIKNTQSTNKSNLELVEEYEPPPLFATGEIKIDQY